MKERGWTDQDTWSLDYTIAKFVYPRLVRFKELCKGFPYGETEKSWNAKLDKMIRTFELVSRGAWDLSNKEYEEVKSGLKLFSEHFLNLWW